MDDTNDKISHLSHRAIRAHSCLVRHKMFEVVNETRHEMARGAPYPSGYVDNIQAITELVLHTSDKLADRRRENARNGQ